VAISQHILGIKPEFSGLRVHPCIGAAIPSFTIVRKCRGATYQITVDNKATGKVRLKVDGAAHDGTLVPMPPRERPSSSSVRPRTGVA